MNEPLLPFFRLKFHPFRPEVPTEALHMTPAVDVFCGRVERTVGDGGFVMVTGEPGSGKSVALRLLSERLRGLRDVVVGTVDHPQSRVSDFYCEVGDIFGVPFPPHNRWAGFKTLRARWGEHIATTLMRPTHAPVRPALRSRVSATPSAKGVVGPAQPQSPLARIWACSVGLTCARELTVQVNTLSCAPWLIDLGGVRSRR
jgi:hypothetical protein